MVKKKKSSILLSDVDNKGGYACVEEKSTEGISVPSPQFCCEPKAAFKKVKSYLKKKIETEFSMWHSGLIIWLVSVVLLVRSPGQCKGLRIWHCHSWGIGHSCYSDLFPGLGTSICYRCSQKTKTKKPYHLQYKST